MIKKERPKNPHKSLPQYESHEDSRMWKQHGIEDIYFQREAQVNFWTVLGGLAMAALLTQLSPLWQEIHKSRWYLLLFLVSSILILANSWVQTTWGSLVLKWPIAIPTTIIMLFSMLIQSIQCLLVLNPSGWMAATAGVILCALLTQLYFEKSGAWKVFPPKYIKRFHINNAVYFFLMLFCLAGAFQLFLFPSHVAEMIWGLISLFLSCTALYLQHVGMKQEKRDLGIL
jgi:hypothetical protein